MGCYASKQGSKHAETKILLGDLELEEVLIQSEVIHTRMAFINS